MTTAAPAPWDIITRQVGKITEIHVIPVLERKDHHFSPNCKCRPVNEEKIVEGMMQMTINHIPLKPDSVPEGDGDAVRRLLGPDGLHGDQLEKK